MKWLGAILIIVASTQFGFIAAKRLSDRPRELRQMKIALQSLEAEIVYGLTPLSEATERIATQMTGPLASFFQTFSTKLMNGKTTVSTAWNEALSVTQAMTSLDKADIEILKQFGTTLGQHDREHQQKQITLTILHLEREESEAKDAQGRYEKMLKSLGLLAGLLLVILLI